MGTKTTRRAKTMMKAATTVTVTRRLRLRLVETAVAVAEAAATTATTAVTMTTSATPISARERLEERIYRAASENQTVTAMAPARCCRIFDNTVRARQQGGYK